jgi:hypothetical protein
MPRDILLVRLVVAHLDTLWAELVEHERAIDWHCLHKEEG